MKLSSPKRSRAMEVNGVGGRSRLLRGCMRRIKGCRYTGAKSMQTMVWPSSELARGQPSDRRRQRVRFLRLPQTIVGSKHFPESFARTYDAMVTLVESRGGAYPLD